MRMERFFSKPVFLLLGFAVCLCRANPSDENSKVQKHQFRVGETFTYFFENTEASYSTTPGIATTQVTDLISMEEVKAKVRMDIVALKGGITKKITLTEVSYRKQTADDIKSGRTVPFAAATDLIPGFAKDFSYTYLVNQSDGEVESKLGGFFKDHMSNQVGMFLYYKMQDFHAFHGSADGVATKRLEVGQSMLSNAINIPLEHGAFHNAPILTIYSRKDVSDGSVQGYFKSIVMGNSYDMAAPAPRVDTNYQYSFYVALAGTYAGLPTRGEMNETILTTDRTTKAVKAIQRMVSLSIQK
jgi:hypothetical protein